MNVCEEAAGCAGPPRAGAVPAGGGVPVPRAGGLVGGPEDPTPRYRQQSETLAADQIQYYYPTPLAVLALTLTYCISSRRQTKLKVCVDFTCCPPDDRAPLRAVDAADWPAVFSRYLTSLGCPALYSTPAQKLFWLLGTAVRLEFPDRHQPRPVPNTIPGLEPANPAWRAGLEGVARQLQVGLTSDLYYWWMKF